MAVFILPGAAVGTVAAIIALAHLYFDTEFWKDFHAIAEIPCYKTADAACVAGKPEIEYDSSFSIEQSHGKLSASWDVFFKKTAQEQTESLSQIKNNLQGFWSQDATLQDLLPIMENAYREMICLFKDAYQKSENDIEEMAKLLSQQHTWQQENSRDDYCRAYYYNSIADMYYALRYQGFRQTVNEREYVCYFFRNSEPDITLQDKQQYTAKFFEQGTYQYSCRRLYNAACEVFDDYPGLKEALKPKDPRYVPFLQPDFSPSRDIFRREKATL